MKREFHDFRTLVTSTEELLTRAGLELLEQRSVTLPVELSSHWETVLILSNLSARDSLATYDLTLSSIALTLFIRGSF